MSYARLPPAAVHTTMLIMSGSRLTVDAVIITSRASSVLLRPPLEADRAAFIALRRRSRHFLEPWEPRPPSHIDFFSDSGFDLELALSVGQRDRRYLICRKYDGAIVGRLSIGGIERGVQQSCHFGYWIGHEFIRNGYATQAVRLALRHVFRDLRLHRAEANLQPHNEASRGVARAAGMQLEGLSPRFLKIRGQWRDHERWAITIEAWRQLQPPVRASR